MFIVFIIYSSNSSSFYILFIRNNTDINPAEVRAIGDNCY